LVNTVQFIGYFGNTIGSIPKTARKRTTVKLTCFVGSLSKIPKRFLRSSMALFFQVFQILP
jgi:hypothetical protein